MLLLGRKSVVDRNTNKHQTVNVVNLQTRMPVSGKLELTVTIGAAAMVQSLSKFRKLLDYW